jgi:hypothetical protein
MLLTTTDQRERQERCALCEEKERAQRYDSQELPQPHRSHREDGEQEAPSRWSDFELTRQFKRGLLLD